MEEKRKSTRYRLVNKVIYAPIEKPEKKHRAASFNISLGGIGINSKREIEDTKKIKFQIFTAKSKIPVEAEGKLIWQKYLPNLGRYQAGFQLE